MQKRVCEHEACECDAPVIVNPINFLFRVLWGICLVFVVVAAMLWFLFLMLFPF